ncbi:MAG: glycogen/starch synthase [Verrucomicrobiales bacterium]
MLSPPPKGAPIAPAAGAPTLPKWRGLWVTVEREPAKAGGLGEVSKTIPQHLNQELGLDVRVIMPALSPVLEEGGWTDSGVTFDLPVNWSGEPPQATFNVLQRFEPLTKTWVYAIANERYFGRFRTLYFRGNHEPTLGADPTFQTILLFNRAAASLAPLLNRSSADDDALARFDGNADFVMVHDWLTGALLALLPKSYQVGRIFMLHNTYDEQRPIAYARDALGLGDLPTGNTYAKFSPLESAVHEAHVIIANQNYVGSLFLRDTFDLLTKNLADKFARRHVFDMHHGLSRDFDPVTTQALESDGFTRLQAPGGVCSREALIAYKQTNKLALQRLMGLDEKKDAVIFSWIGRFDPLQKGFYLVMEDAKPFLRKHPRAQWIIGGSNSNNDSNVREFLDEVANDPEMSGRIYARDHFVGRDQVIRISAGSDFFMMPSLYEPFGLAQLEAMSLGCIPIVHGVDGLRSTVSDPFIDGLDFDGSPERVATYGQVGMKIDGMNVPVYRQAINRQVDGEPLNQQQSWARTDSQRKLRLALARSLRLVPDSERFFKIIENGRRFVETEHNWAHIIRRYEAPLKSAVAMAHGITA